jgi:hypothetical protein
VRLDQWIAGDFAPYRDECVAESLAGKLAAGLAQFSARLDPVHTAVAIGWFPGNGREQDGAMRAGKGLTVAQRVQAAR